jgi:hypothetical protein
MAVQQLQENDKRIVRALNLLTDADSVELKLTVPDSDQRSAVVALDMDVLMAELRQVVFFDTPDLRLNRAGVVVRARRIKKGGDTIVKIRPVVPADLPRDLRRSGNFTIELDVMPGTFVCSGSLKDMVDNAEVTDVVRGTRRIRKLFSREQRELYKEHAPKGLDLDSLRPFGPINIAKLKFSMPTLDGRMASAELWFYPDGSRILELSTKCAPGEAFQVAAETRAHFTRCGIRLTGEQQTKTRRALQHFSKLVA